MPTIAEVRQQFPQYSDMSDEALGDALYRKFYSDMPREQFNQKVGLAQQPSVFEDMAKTIPAAAGRLVANTLGQPGDIGALQNAIIQKATGTQATAPAQAPVGSSGIVEPGLENIAPGPRAMLPSSETIRHLIEKVTGPLYQPRTTVGGIADKAIQLAPAAIGSSTNLPTRLATQVGLPAVAGQAAQELGGGPVTQAGAEIASAILSHKLTTPKAVTPKPMLNDVEQAASAGYQSPEIAAVSFKPQAIDNLSNRIIADLNAAKRNSKIAGTTHALVEDMKNPVQGNTHTFEDIQTTRQLLQEQAGNYADKAEQGAATLAIKKIDAYLNGFPQADLATGNAQKAVEAYKTANANHSAFKTAQNVSTKLANAELAAGSAHSGGNINNNTRQALKPIVKGAFDQQGNRVGTKQARGLTDEEAQAIVEGVKGSTPGNYLRAAGKFLGGGGGLGAMHAALGGGGVGSLIGGPIGAAIGAAAPIAGYGLKKVGDALTLAKANRIVDQILSRSPEAANFAAAAARQAGVPPALATTRQGLLTGVVAAQQNGLLSNLALPLLSP